jgi:hypothetical protein
MAQSTAMQQRARRCAFGRQGPVEGDLSRGARDGPVQAYLQSRMCDRADVEWRALTPAGVNRRHCRKLQTALTCADARPTNH